MRKLDKFTSSWNCNVMAPCKSEELSELGNPENSDKVEL